ncbi:hypothetical protein [Puia dinghuensis]|uniref:DUF4381 domain-containing protein n=1 Tax=Puia dinghuensis TaxID=1792502 RepID=A0A8J2XVS4_9BACT|nr:hypothetical protein [Puia dinghuensis]GGB14031.1 hypothetical protein GCM10011511_42220 [Puia dinghuensis]
MRPLRSYIIATLLCLPVTLLHAQKKSTAPLATVKATVDKQNILIGQHIQLMLEATVPDTLTIHWSWPLPDSLLHFDWVEKHNVDTVVRPGQRYYRQYLTITSYDSGVWAIPRIAFVVGKKSYLTDSIRIDVGYSKIDPSKDYHDIKEIIDVPNPLAVWIPWIVAAVTVISLVLVFWLVRKRKLRLAAVPIKPAPKLSPLEDAIRQLDELQKQELPANGSVKIYYSRLGEIFRAYLLRRIGISSFAETSEELIGQLRGSLLPRDQFDSLAETLRMSDFVKFAKYQPGIADSDQHYRVIRASIESLDKLRQEEEHHQAMAAGKVATAVTAAPNQQNN